MSLGIYYLVVRGMFIIVGTSLFHPVRNCSIPYDRTVPYRMKKGGSQLTYEALVGGVAFVYWL